MQDTDTAQIILTELRELRADVNNNTRATEGRLSSLETSMYSLIGNGQPGRIGKLEQTVDQLKQYKWWLIGVCAGVSGIVSFIVVVLK